MEDKIAVCVHSGKHIEPEAYANHIIAITSWALKYNLVTCFAARENVCASRNKLVAKAKEFSVTKMLLLDDDHIVEPSLLPILLSNKDCAVVSGIVCKRVYPYKQIGFMRVKDNREGSYEIRLPLDGRSYEVDICAFGCTLIDMKVFDELDEPYFKDTISRSGGTYYNKRSDINFCDSVRKLGKMIRIDTRAVVVHLGNPERIDPRDHLPENLEEDGLCYL